MKGVVFDANSGIARCQAKTIRGFKVVVTKERYLMHFDLYFL